MSLSFEKLRDNAQKKAEQAVDHQLDDDEFVAILYAVLDAMEMTVDERGNVITRYTITPSYEQKNFRGGGRRGRRK